MRPGAVCTAHRLTHSGVASSLKLGEQKAGLVWRARERETITGVWGTAPSRGSTGQSPRWWARGRSPPEADGILVLEHTFLRCLGADNGSRSD